MKHPPPVSSSLGGPVLFFDTQAPQDFGGSPSLCWTKDMKRCSAHTQAVQPSYNWARLSMLVASLMTTSTCNNKKASLNKDWVEGQRLIFRVKVWTRTKTQVGWSCRNPSSGLHLSTSQVSSNLKAMKSVQTLGAISSPVMLNKKLKQFRPELLVGTAPNMLLVLWV